MDINLVNFAASSGAIILGAVLQASTGLGGGLIIVPLLALISVELIPGPMVFASIGLSFLMAYQGRSHIRIFLLTPVVLGLMIGIGIGALGISAISFDRAGLFLGILVLLAAGISVIGVKIQLTRRNFIIAGAISGFMGATVAIGAPVLALLYQHEEGKTLRSTLGFLYFISSLMIMVFLHFVGRFGFNELRLGCYLMPGFLMGYCLASPFAKLLDKGYTRFAVLLMSTISAVILIVKSM